MSNIKLKEGTPKTYVRAMELSPRVKKMWSKHWKKTFPEPEQKTEKPLPDVDTLLKYGNNDQKVAALCELLLRMPTGFWGENGPVTCDRHLWRMAKELADNLQS